MAQCKKCNGEYDLSKMENGYCLDCKRENNLRKKNFIFKYWKDVTIMLLLSMVIYQLIKIKSDVSSIESDVSSMEYDVSSIKFDVSSIKSDVSSMESDVSSIKIDLAYR